MFGEKEEGPSYGTHWGLFFLVDFHLYYIVNFFYYYEPIIIYLNENMINFKLKLNLHTLDIIYQLHDTI